MACVCASTNQCDVCSGVCSIGIFCSLLVSVKVAAEFGMLFVLKWHIGSVRTTLNSIYLFRLILRFRDADIQLAHIQHMRKI